MRQDLAGLDARLKGQQGVLMLGARDAGHAPLAHLGFAPSGRGRTGGRDTTVESAALEDTPC